MRLLFLTDEPFSFGKTPSRRKAEGFLESARRNFSFQKTLAAAFAKRGDDVLFVTAEPSETPDPPRFVVRSEGDLLRLTLFLTAESPFSGVSKALSFFSRNAAAVAGFFQPDVVVSAGFCPVSIFAAEKIARFSHAVLVTFVTASPQKSGVLPWEKIVLNAALHRIRTKSAAVFGSYPRFSSDFSGKNAFSFLLPPPEPLSSPSKNTERVRSVIETLREGNTFVLAIPGPFQKGYSLRALLRAAQSFGKKTAVFLLGNGPEKPALERALRENGLTNVTFGDEVPLEELPFVLSGADAVFLSESAVFGPFRTETDRFLSAFRSGKPVLAAVSACSDLFRESENAVFTVPEDVEGLRKALETLQGFSAEHRAQLGERGRQFAVRHGFPAFFDGFSAFLHQLVSHQKENKNL